MVSVVILPLNLYDLTYIPDTDTGSFILSNTGQQLQGFGLDRQLKHIGYSSHINRGK